MSAGGWTPLSPPFPPTKRAEAARHAPCTSGVHVWKLALARPSRAVAPGGNAMKKWCLGALMSGVVLITVAACSSNKNGNQAPCKTGAEACVCYANDTCDDALTCLAGLCFDLQGIGGASLGQAGQPESSGGAADLPEGG